MHQLRTGFLCRPRDVLRAFPLDPVKVCIGALHEADEGDDESGVAEGGGEGGGVGDVCGDGGEKVRAFGGGEFVLEFVVDGFGVARGGLDTDGRGY